MCPCTPRQPYHTIGTATAWVEKKFGIVAEQNQDLNLYDKQNYKVLMKR